MVNARSTIIRLQEVGSSFLYVSFVMTQRIYDEKKRNRMRAEDGH